MITERSWNYVAGFLREKQYCSKIKSMKKRSLPRLDPLNCWRVNCPRWRALSPESPWKGGDTDNFFPGIGFSKSIVIRIQCQPWPQSQKERSLRVGRWKMPHVRGGRACLWVNDHVLQGQAQECTQEGYMCLLGPGGGRNIPLQVPGSGALHVCQACLEMDPVISARPEHRVSASRALASFLWSQRPSPLGLRRNRRRSGRKYLPRDSEGRSCYQQRKIVCYWRRSILSKSLLCREVIQILGRNMNKADGLRELPGLDCGWLWPVSQQEMWGQGSQMRTAGQAEVREDLSQGPNPGPQGAMGNGAWASCHSQIHSYLPLARLAGKDGVGLQVSWVG